MDLEVESALHTTPIGKSMDYSFETRISTTFEDLAPLSRLAKRERLSFKPTQNTTWFGLYVDDELIGCGAAIWGTKAQTWMRLKAGLILPEWRGLGGYRPLVFDRAQYAFEHGAEYVVTITRHPAVFEHWGWHLVEGSKNLFQLDR